MSIVVEWHTCICLCELISSRALHFTTRRKETGASKHTTAQLMQHGWGLKLEEHSDERNLIPMLLIYYSDHSVGRERNTARGGC